MAMGLVEMSRRHRDDERHAGQPVLLGEIIDDRVAELRFQRQVEKLHALGSRAVGELLAEIGEQRSCRTFIDQRLEAYSRLDPEIVKAVDGDKFPRPPIYEVKK